MLDNASQLVKPRATFSAWMKHSPLQRSWSKRGNRLASCILNMIEISEFTLKKCEDGLVQYPNNIYCLKELYTIQQYIIYDS